jgi:hypothetical protein
VAYMNMDDNFADSLGNEELSDGAFRLHVAGLLYCNRLLTDGLVPAHRIHRLTRTYKPRLLDELVICEKWRPVDAAFAAPEMYEIADYLLHNPTRAEVEKKRKAAKARKQRWEERHGNANH